MNENPASDSEKIKSTSFYLIITFWHHTNLFWRELAAWYFLIRSLFGRNRLLLMPPPTHSGFITFIVCREPSITPESVWNPPLLTAPHLMAAVLAAGHFFIRWNCLLAAGSGQGHLPPPRWRGRTKINPTNNQGKKRRKVPFQWKQGFFGGGGGISNVFGQVCHMKAQEWCFSLC